MIMINKNIKNNRSNYNILKTKINKKSLRKNSFPKRNLKISYRFFDHGHNQCQSDMYAQQHIGFPVFP